MTRSVSSRIASSPKGFLSSPFVTNVLSAEELHHIRQYKYTGKDNSLTLRYILCHWYEFMVTLVPMNVAPNVLTLLGGLCMLSAFCLLWYHSPNWDSEVPAWVFLTASVLVFFYQSFDNIDGKQARRTKSSSPIGDLLDHGVDSLCLSLGAIEFAIAMQFGRSCWALAAIGFAWTPFFFATWEQYFVDGLVLGYINGAMEGILSIVLLLAYAGLWGTTTFQQYLVELKWFAGIWLVFMALGNIFNVARNIQRRKNSLKSSKTAAEAVSSRAVSLLYVLPLFLQLACLMLTGWYGGDVVLHGPVKQTVAYFVMVTLAFGYSNSKLTLAYLAGSPYRHLFKTHIPLVLVAVNCLPWVRIAPPDVLLYACSFTIILAYIQFVYATFSGMARFLGIPNVLSISHVSKMSNARSFARH